MKIYDGRNEFFQWDLDQKLIVSDPDITEVHYCNQTDDCALVCEVYEEDGQRLVNVPNILFQEALPIRAYAYAGCCTKQSVIFTVKPRSKPTDYVYTETEVKSWDEFYKRLDELELGARAIIDVEELPTEDINEALLYRTHEGVYWYDGEWNKVADEADLDALADDIAEVESIAKGAQQAVSFGNYSTMITALNSLPSGKYNCGQNIMIVTLQVPDLWISDIAEESVEYEYVSDEAFVTELKENGSVQVGFYVLSQLETQKVDLTDYVKNTDYATKEKAGIMSPKSQSLLVSNGGLYIVGANQKLIDAKASTNHPLTPSMLDYAVKVGVTTNTEKLTDEEKGYARRWLGVYHDIVSEEYQGDEYDISGGSTGIEFGGYYFATTNIPSMNELDKYVAYFDAYNGATSYYEYFSFTLDRFNVTEMQGAKKLSFSNPLTPQTIVLIVTEYDACNSAYGTSFVSNGVYLGNNWNDYMGSNSQMYSYGSCVISLCKIARSRKIPDRFLDLENSPVIKELDGKMGDIDTALDSIIAVQNSLIGGES